MQIGLISDTHGLLRPQALEALRDSDLIVHAGDIGRLAVIAELSSIARTVAIRGNVDEHGEAGEFPETATVSMEGQRIYILHDLKKLNIDPVAEGFGLVVSGHSRKPVIRSEAGVLYVNPGSAGPRRFKLPVSVGRVRLQGGKFAAQICELDV
ncbi:metallophosphoesterase family protein [Gilvimarinus sp. F26214L]|uniref:metallophosphoesterase family protein n=1 Tax=Gilvimarinus sp. DZF01 TaxID=3461371 RepID=UPI00404684F1